MRVEEELWRSNSILSLSITGFSALFFDPSWYEHRRSGTTHSFVCACQMDGLRLALVVRLPRARELH